MSIKPRSADPVLSAENAPFSPEQRAWLNGLFAGLYGLTEGVTALSAQEVAQLVPGVALAPAADTDDGAPWHDPAMPLADRVKLAEGKPLPRRMMAAMAQQDCGQCGYNCKDYSAAIFARTEERLNLCVPGGKETARMLKQLHAELEAPAAAPGTPRTGNGKTGRARHFARSSLDRHACPASSPQQGRVAEGNLAHRIRSPAATWTMRSVIRSASFR